MFTFPIEPHELFAERSRQFASWGISWDTIRRVQMRVEDTWREGPGGWTYEWWQEAEATERKQKFLLAAMLYGAARFPTIATPMRERALEHQVAAFTRAMKPGLFERRKLALASMGGRELPVHLYGTASDRPLVLLSGGVDTGKLELHRLAHELARIGRFRVAAIDMPGTGESCLPLTPDADDIYRELLSTLAPTGRKAVFGVSFGGHWAAKLALTGAVDAAIDLGGPTLFEWGKKQANGLPNGMMGIISNALRMPALPAVTEFAETVQPFSLRQQGLLDRGNCAPMLVINGENDQYIPQEDSTSLAHYRDNEVWLMRGMTHCAAEGLKRIAPAMIAWLRLRLYGETFSTRSALWFAERLLPARLAQQD